MTNFAHRMAISSIRIRLFLLVMVAVLCFTSNASAGSSLEQSGYAEVGKVYRDPDKGKLVMVQG